MKLKPCPHCKKSNVPKKANPYWPFCSERCKLIDLGKWASGEYRIPGEPIKKDSDENEAKEEKDVH